MTFMDKKKIDQTIRSEGAENYVRAILMMEFGVITSVASRSMPSYDLVAHNLTNNYNCRISVKYRTAINADGFRFTERNEYDFLVAIIGNRGKVGDHIIDVNPKEPHKSKVFIFPKYFVQKNLIRRGKERLLKNPLLKHSPKKFRKYENNWHRITNFLRLSNKRLMRQQ